MDRPKWLTKRLSSSSDSSWTNAKMIGEWLSIAEFAYNDWVHVSTHSSLFMMDPRQNHWLGIEPLRESCLETLNNLASGMEVAMKEAHSALARAAGDMAWFYDAHQKQAPL